MFTELTHYKLLHTLLDESKEKVCVLNSNFEVEYFNSGYQKHVLNRHNFLVELGKPIIQLPDEEQTKAWTLALNRALSGETLEHVDIKPEYQEMVYAKMVLSPISIDELEKGVLIKIQDVSSEFKMERDLAAFKLLASNMPHTDAYLCDGDGIILLAEGGEMKKYDLKPSDFVGKNVFDMAKEIGLNIQTEKRKLLKGEPISTSHQINNYHYIIDLFPLVQDKKLKNIVYLTRNVTELYNNALRLEHINETKDTILSIVAHDLRNPITAMLGLSEVLSEHRFFDQTDLNLYRSVINQSCNNALSIINDLLDIAELGKDGFALETELTEINYFTRQSIKEFNIISKQKQIEFEFEATHTDLFANINANKFRRVLSNIISNAIKFSEPRSKVFIKTALMPEERILISIRDTGIGIPEELQQIIFDKFTKAGRTGTLGEKSLGLGMSIVKQIVTLHQGNIWLKSKENEGTSVFIELKSAI